MRSLWRNLFSFYLSLMINHIFNAVSKRPKQTSTSIWWFFLLFNPSDHSCFLAFHLYAPNKSGSCSRANISALIDFFHIKCTLLSPPNTSFSYWRKQSSWNCTLRDQSLHCIPTMNQKLNIHFCQPLVLSTEKLHHFQTPEFMHFHKEVKTTASKTKPTTKRLSTEARILQR